MQIQYFSVEIETYQDLSRLVKTFLIISDFCGFLDYFLDLDQEIMDFYKYLDRDFSSQPYLFTFCASKLAKSVGNSNFFQKVSTQILIFSKKLSQFISMVWISHDNLNKNLDTAKSRLKSLNFKTLDQEKKKLVLKLRTFSILIGLDC
jgi:hypothetical protein